MIKIIENEIVNKLKEKFSSWEVDSFPSDFENYTFTSPVGCLLVRFEKSTTTNQQTLTSVSGMETYNFTIFMGVRYLQKHNQSYEHLDLLKRTLNGLEILHKRLVLQNREYIDSINGDLWYGAEVSLELPITDEYEDKSIANTPIMELIDANQHKY